MAFISVGGKRGQEMGCLFRDFARLSAGPAARDRCICSTSRGTQPCGIGGLKPPMGASSFAICCGVSKSWFRGMCGCATVPIREMTPPATVVSSVSLRSPVSRVIGLFLCLRSGRSSLRFIGDQDHAIDGGLALFPREQALRDLPHGRASIAQRVQPLAIGRKGYRAVTSARSPASRRPMAAGLATCHRDASAIPRRA